MKTFFQVLVVLNILFACFNCYMMFVGPHVARSGSLMVVNMIGASVLVLAARDS